MKLIQLVGAAQFIDKLTYGTLVNERINRAVAYLRANGIAFYDDWSREHVVIVDSMPDHKVSVIKAIKIALS